MPDYGIVEINYLFTDRELLQRLRSETDLEYSTIYYIQYSKHILPVPWDWLDEE